jgi:signal transduction histidine kinase/ActR/RegA family two-component response regulator
MLTGEIRTYQMEKRYVHRKGHVVWVLLSVSLVRTGDGCPRYFISQIQDISERKQAEAERDRLRDELHHAQKLEALGRLAGGVAHDFNNMLTAINGYCELLLGKLDPASTMHAHAGQIRRAAEQASALPRQLLAFSRKQKLQPDLVDLNDVIATTSDLLRRLISEAIRFETRTDGHALAHVDPSQLEQVLVNLALNARDAMPTGGTLTIATSILEVDEELAAEYDASTGEYVVVSVSDTGHGMDADTRERAFDPFFTTKPLGQGSGLGLASVYGTVTQSGGFVRLESAPGEGTIVHLHFPSVQGLQRPDRALAAQPSPETYRPVVLLAEDEQLVRDLTVTVLEEAGFEVHAAADGREALGVFEQINGAIDVLVTDMVMPEMGGLALGEAILARSPRTPIVYMSGYTEESPNTTDDRDTAKTFLPKPFAAQELVTAVKAASADAEARARNGAVVPLRRRSLGA